MTCDEARAHLLDLQRGRLAPDLHRETAHHVEGCSACTRASAEEELLTSLLRRLPARPASPALKRRLAQLAASAVRTEPVREPPRARARPGSRFFAPALAAAAAALIVAGATLVGRTGGPRGAAPLDVLASEAVSDHLRVLQRERPVDVESTGRHDVKPWFEGKLDFAPAVPPAVGPEMRLVGGAVGWYVDRPAAVVVYHLRRHVVTLLAFRADGLAWPAARDEAEARVPSQRALRGFHVFLWRSGGVGYALVSDADPAELATLAARLSAQT